MPTPSFARSRQAAPSSVGSGHALHGSGAPAAVVRGMCGLVGAFRNASSTAVSKIFLPHLRRIGGRAATKRPRFCGMPYCDTCRCGVCVSRHTFYFSKAERKQGQTGFPRALSASLFTCSRFAAAGPAAGDCPELRRLRLLRTRKLRDSARFFFIVCTHRL